MRPFLLAALVAVLVVPAAAIADRGSGGSAHGTVGASAQKQQRVKAKSRSATRVKSHVRRSSIGDEREVRGRIVSLTPLTVGSLTCTVPSGLSIAPFHVGDFVEVTCDLIRGQWVLRKIELEDDVVVRNPRADDEDEDDEREVEGRIVSVSPLTVGSLTCTVPVGVSLVRFRVGDLVEITCDRTRGQWTLRKIEAEDDDDDDGNSGPGRGDDDHDGDRSGSNSGPGSSGGSGSGSSGSGSDDD